MPPLTKKRPNKKSEFKTDKKSSQYRLLVEKATYLRVVEGKMFSEILELTNDYWKSEQAVHKAISTYLKRTAQAEADSMRMIWLARLERLYLQMDAAAAKQDAYAAGQIIKIADRMAKMLGLDAPTKLAHQGEMGFELIIRDESERKKTG